MFSVVSVCPLGFGSHVTITQDALDLTLQDPPPVLDPIPGPPYTGTWLQPLLALPSGQDWRPVQTCSLEDFTVLQTLPLTGADI